MCKAFDDMMRDSKREGIREGRREGERKTERMNELIQKISLCWACDLCRQVIKVSKN